MVRRAKPWPIQPNSGCARWVRRRRLVLDNHSIVGQMLWMPERLQESPLLAPGLALARQQALALERSHRRQESPFTVIPGVGVQDMEQGLGVAHQIQGRRPARQADDVPGLLVQAEERRQRLLPELSQALAHSGTTRAGRVSIIR